MDNEGFDEITDVMEMQNIGERNEDVEVDTKETRFICFICAISKASIFIATSFFSHSHRFQTDWVLP